MSFPPRTARFDTARRGGGALDTLFIAAAVALLGVIALIHLVTLGDHFEEARWLGGLFVALVAGCAVAAIGVIAQRRFGWMLGAIDAAVPFVGFVLAATTGLGGVHEDFTESYGIPALGVEAALLAIVVVRLMSSPSRGSGSLVLRGRRSAWQRTAAAQRREAASGAWRPHAAVRLPILAVAAVVAAAVALPSPAAGASGSFVGPFNTVNTIASTVPKNGDVNPYGVAVAPVTTGRLTAGDVLVSNFNNHRNLQGTGTTIVEISPAGTVNLFAKIDQTAVRGRCPGGVGLTTALVALRSGWVIVGSLPTKDGTSGTAQPGCLIVLDPEGNVAQTISGDPINGPWDMTAVDNGSTATLFVTNVLNGTVAMSPNVVNGGTVVRIALATPAGQPPSVGSKVVIGRGFGERTDPSALVVGPTGLGVSGTTLYVADSVGNRVASIDNALTRMMPASGTTVSANGAINDPLGLAVAPNGDILTTNGADGNLVETSPDGTQVVVKMLDTSPAPPGPNGAGTLFGLAVVPDGSGVYFVDDGTNTLELLH